MNNTMYVIVLIFTYVSFVKSVGLGYPLFSKFWPRPKPVQTNEDSMEYEILDTHNTGFVNVLNDMETMNAYPILFDLHEVTMLSTLPNHGVYKIAEKEVALSKYKRKMQDLQCTNGAIARSMIDHLRRITEQNDKTGAVVETKPILVWFKTTVARMLSVLLCGRTVAYRWLWLLYFRIYGALDTDRTDRDWLATYLTEDKHLNGTISAFTGMCVIHGYLAKDYSGTNRLRKPKTVYKLMENSINKLYDNVTLDHVYKYADYFDVDNLYLRRFWHEHDAICTAVRGEPEACNVSTSLLENAATLIANHVNNDVWPVKPFKANIYLKYMISICKVKLYVYAWIHLTCYRQIIISKQYSASDLEIVSDNFYSVFTKAAGLLYVHDEFIDDLRYFILYIKTSKEHEIQNMATFIMNAINVELIVLHENRLSHDFNATFDDQNGTIKFLSNNLYSLDKYFGNIKIKLDQIDFVFISFFIDGEQKYEESFVSNERLPNRKPSTQFFFQLLFNKIFTR